MSICVLQSMSVRALEVRKVKNYRNYVLPSLLEFFSYTISIIYVLHLLLPVSLSERS